MRKALKGEVLDCQSICFCSKAPPSWLFNLSHTSWCSSLLADVFGLSPPSSSTIYKSSPLRSSRVGSPHHQYEISCSDKSPAPSTKRQEEGTEASFKAFIIASTCPSGFPGPVKPHKSPFFGSHFKGLCEETFKFPLGLSFELSWHPYRLILNIPSRQL